MATRILPIHYAGNVETGEEFGAFKFPSAATVTKVRITARTAPTTSNLTLSCRKDDVEFDTATLTAASTTEETDLSDTAFTTSEELSFQWSAADSGDTAEEVTIFVTYTD